MDDIGCWWTVWASHGKTPGLKTVAPAATVGPVPWPGETSARTTKRSSCSAKPSLKPIGTRLSAMAASMSSWRRSSNGSRKLRPPTAAKGSTISASRGQGRGVVEVATLQSGGGARRWRTRWLTLLTTATLLSQRAKPSPLWSRLCPETRIGRGLARIAPGGKAIERFFALTVGVCPPCSFVVRLLLHVLLCVFMLRRVPLPIRVSPESRQRLQRLRTERRLNAGAWLRALIDEALEEQQTTDGQRPRRATLEDAHNPITPIGSTGSLPSRSTVPEEESPGPNDHKTRSANVPNGPVDSGSNRGIQWGE